MTTNTQRLLVIVGICSLAACDREARSPSETGNRDRQRAIEELGDAVVVLREMSRDRSIPQAARSRARCVVVVPSMVNAAFLVGGRHGHGVVTCRTAVHWSAPSFVTLSGGSAGLQIGIESADLIMLVTSERGMGHLFQSSFQLGVDAAAAAGPTGKAAEASTDTTMTAEILSYARSRGLFAGVELSGVVMKQDRAASFALYGASAEVHEILIGNVPPTREVAGFIEQVRDAFPLGTQGAAPDPSLSSVGP